MVGASNTLGIDFCRKKGTSKLHATPLFPRLTTHAPNL